MKPLLLILTLVVFSTLVTAQKVSVKSEALFIVDPKPKVIEVPLPKYPVEAAGLGGEVTVTVAVDENGSVVVERTSGPRPICPDIVNPRVLALRRAAEDAALKARFKPAVVDGKPTRSTGWLKFDFQVPAERASEDEAINFSASNEDIEPSENGRKLLNGKAISLPSPAYPPAARAVRASGTVIVQVLISEDGNMYSAEAISGHPLLRYSAVSAACKAKFTQTLLDGKPVKVSGTVHYNFVP
jgi:TonB family protein